jgi:transcriptional regulator of PTS gene
MISNIAEIHEGTRRRIKDEEKAVIYGEIHKSPGSSRKSITAKLKFRPSTVSKIVGELITDRLVLETEERIPDLPGRPQVLLRPNPDRLSAVTLYVQAREIRAARININEDILEEYARALPADVTNAAFLHMCSTAFGSVTRKVSPGEEVLGAAVSLVGTVNSSTKTLVSTARWRGLRNVEFSALENKLGVPVILNRMQDAELRYFIQKNPCYWKKNLLFIHWGFGIGAAYAHTGVIAGSALGRFCEIGHTRISLDSNLQCQCGSYGCLETVAALWAIQGQSRTIPADVADERRLADFVKDADFSEDPVVDLAVRHMGLAVLNLHQIFYPDAVVMIGPLAENPRLFRRIEDYIRSELPEYARRKVEFVMVPGGYRGAVRGSVYPFFEARLGELLRTYSF